MLTSVAVGNTGCTQHARAHCPVFLSLHGLCGVVVWCMHGRGLWLTLSCVDSWRGEACRDPAVGVPFGSLYVTALVACPLRC